MRTLIGWDNAAEAELISLYLNATDDAAVITTDRGEFLSRAEGADEFDVILMPTSFPDPDGGFEAFRRIRALRPDCPIVGACHTEDVYQVARFLANGLRSYIPRDLGGDFVFLLQTTLESTVAAVRAEKEQKVAEKMRQEIESVRRFQDSIIPTEIFQPPGYQTAAVYEPAQIRVFGGQPVNMAGGDYYEVFALDKKHMVLLVGDAAGHGMRACMSILVMHTLIRMLHEKRFHKPSAFVEEVNRHFCNQAANRADGGLITLLYGVLRFDTHDFEWTSAGHPAPLMHDRAQGTIAPVANDEFAGPPLGVDADIRYATTRTRLPAGSRLLLFTDGLVEASGNEHLTDHFGVPGVSATLRNCAESSAKETLATLLADSHAHTNGLGRHDDTSAVLVDRQL